MTNKYRAWLCLAEPGTVVQVAERLGISLEQARKAVSALTDHGQAIPVGPRASERTYQATDKPVRPDGRGGSEPKTPRYRVWLALRERGMTIDQLAAMFGTPRETMRNIVRGMAEAGQAYPVVSALRNRAAVYGATDVPPSNESRVANLRRSFVGNGEGRIALEVAWPL